jgi:hypothetical protein
VCDLSNKQTTHFFNQTCAILGQHITYVKNHERSSNNTDNMIQVNVVIA